MRNLRTSEESTWSSAWSCDLVNCLQDQRDQLGCSSKRSPLSPSILSFWLRIISLAQSRQHETRTSTLFDQVHSTSSSRSCRSRFSRQRWRWGRGNEGRIRWEEGKWRASQERGRRGHAGRLYRLKRLNQRKKEEGKKSLFTFLRSDLPLCLFCSLSLILWNTAWDYSLELPITRRDRKESVFNYYYFPKFSLLTQKHELNRLLFLKSNLSSQYGAGGGIPYCWYWGCLCPPSWPIARIAGSMYCWCWG